MANTFALGPVFFGAGASAALGYAPTKQFLDQLKNSLPEASDLGRLLRAMCAVKGVENVEHIVAILDTVSELGQSFAAKFFETWNTIIFPNFSGSYSTFESHSRSLSDKIREEIFRAYSWRNENVVKLGLYDSFFSYFGVNKGRLQVFTTNYDRIIEQYCASAQYELQDGFVYDSITRINQWQPEKAFKLSPTDTGKLQLFKLHGSLNWRMRLDGLIEQVTPEERIGPGGESTYSQNLLIYPGQKSEPVIEPFRYLYQAFRRVLENADNCYVIGFSFRDEYINSLFLDFVKRNGTVLHSISRSASSDLSTLFGAEYDILVRSKKVVPYNITFESACKEFPSPSG